MPVSSTGRPSIPRMSGCTRRVEPFPGALWRSQTTQGRSSTSRDSRSIGLIMRSFVPAVVASSSATRPATRPARSAHRRTTRAVCNATPATFAATRGAHRTEPSVRPTAPTSRPTCRSTLPGPPYPTLSRPRDGAADHGPPVSCASCRTNAGAEPLPGREPKQVAGRSGLGVDLVDVHVDDLNRTAQSALTETSICCPGWPG